MGPARPCGGRAFRNQPNQPPAAVTSILSGGGDEARPCGASGARDGRGCEGRGRSRSWAQAAPGWRRRGPLPRGSGRGAPGAGDRTCLPAVARLAVFLAAKQPFRLELNQVRGISTKETAPGFLFSPLSANFSILKEIGGQSDVWLLRARFLRRNLGRTRRCCQRPK